MTGPAGPAAMVAVAVLGAGWSCRPRPTARRPSGPSPPTEPEPRPINRARRVGIVIGGLALIVAVTAPALLVPTAAITTLWIASRPRVAARRRRDRIERELPEAIDLLVLAVRAGLTPTAAIREVADSTPEPVGDGFADVVRRLERGQPFADAVTTLREALGPPADALVDVVTTTTRYGLPLEPVLDQLAAEARDARRRRRQAEARRLPIRLSFPLVACTLPSFVLLAIVPAVIAALSSLGPSVW